MCAPGVAEVNAPVSLKEKSMSSKRMKKTKEKILYKSLNLPGPRTFPRGRF